jgi:hypothetical protein
MSASRRHDWAMLSKLARCSGFIVSLGHSSWGKKGLARKGSILWDDFFDFVAAFVGCDAVLLSS